MATDLDSILARLDRLEAENMALRHAARGRDADRSTQRPTATASVSRRQLLRRASVTALGVGMVAASAATLGRSTPASATDGDFLRIGDDQQTASVTTLTNSTTDADMFTAQTDGKGTALTGGSAHGFGVLGSSNSNAGVFGVGARGGVFLGSKAAISIQPSRQTGHPHTGQLGDIVLDKSKRLWLCKGGTSWHRLA